MIQIISQKSEFLNRHFKRAYASLRLPLLTILPSIGVTGSTYMKPKNGNKLEELAEGGNYFQVKGKYVTVMRYKRELRIIFRNATQCKLHATVLMMSINAKGESPRNSTAFYFLYNDCVVDSFVKISLPSGMVWGAL